MHRFVAARDALREERRQQVDDWERGNLAQARAIRHAYDNGGK
jgi:hypothetical protein